MANEIRMTGELRWNDPSTTDFQRWKYSAKDVDKVADPQHSVRGKMSVGITAEDIILGDVATPGLAMFYNADATNFVHIGKMVGLNFEQFLKIKPLEWAGPIRLANISPQAKANTAAVELHYWIIED